MYLIIRRGCFPNSLSKNGGGLKVEAPHNHEQHYICSVNRVNVFYPPHLIQYVGLYVSFCTCELITDMLTASRAIEVRS